VDKAVPKSQVTLIFPKVVNANNQIKNHLISVQITQMCEECYSIIKKQAILLFSV
jgi:hypothetical protein